MAGTVKLEDVTADNWRAVTRLKLHDTQKDLVASNVYSIAESKFDPGARPRAIYAGNELVGFIMYDVGEGRARKALIYRFMIDREHQGKGYGRDALRLALDEIKALSRIKTIAICYMRSNPVAKDFYGSFGFEETGREDRGEVVAELQL